MTITVLGCTIALSKILNSGGLILDISGVVLLFKYGLPPDISRTGATYIITEQRDEAEVERARRYDRLGYLGLAFLIGGFVFQLASNFF